MRVLIIGGTGFVGRHLASACVRDGDDVFVTAREPGRSRSLAHLAGRVEVRGADVLDEASIAAVVEQARPDRVFHLAGAASPSRSFDTEEMVLATNLLGTLHVLRAVRSRAREARVLYVGSAHEYGRVEPARQPISEDTPIVPLSPYGVSRAAASLLAQRYALTEEIHVVRTRSFNHTGPGQSDEYSAPSFAEQLVRAKRAGARGPVEVHAGALEVSRDFSGVAAVVRAYRALLERGARGEVYNVCSGEAITVGELLARLARIVGVEARAVDDPGRRHPSDVPLLLGDPSRLEKATGVTLRGSLDQALIDLVKEREASGGS